MDAFEDNESVKFGLLSHPSAALPDSYFSHVPVHIHHEFYDTQNDQFKILF